MADTPGYVEDIALIGTQQYALLAAGPAGLLVIDFSDSAISGSPAGCRHRGHMPVAVAYRDGKAYVAADRGGLQVFALDQPASPRLLGTVETTLAYGVASTRATSMSPTAQKA